MFSAEKKRIAFVIHRFHDDICGGAEQECMQYVEHLKNYFDIDVLTTTSSNDGTWENTYPEGIEVKNGYKIRRFPVTELKSLNFNLLPEFNSKCHSYTEELDKLLDNGPLSPELFFYVRENWNHYESIFFFTYCFFSCAFCSLKIPNAILIPTAHDEELFKFDHFTKLFNSVKGFLFQTEEEKKLVESKIGKVAVPYEICGVGIDALNCEALDSGLALETSNSQYLLYVGRICEGKGVPELLDFFKRYKKDSKSNLKLILIGKDYLNLHSDNDITVAGFVSEKERNSYMKAAEALVLPSRNESLSMVCLEAMSLGTPIIVSGFCDVLVSHVKKSDSGSFSYRNYEEFKKAVLNIENRKLSPDQRSYYANRARNYVKSNYSWEVIVSKITALVDKVAIENEQLITSKAIRKHDLLNSSCFIYCCKNEAEVQELSLSLNSLRLYGNIPKETEIFIFHLNLPAEIKSTIFQDNQNFFNIRFLAVPQSVSQLEGENLRFSLLNYFKLNKLSTAERIIYLCTKSLVLSDLNLLVDQNLKKCYTYVPVDYRALMEGLQNKSMEDYYELLLKDTDKYNTNLIITSNNISEENTELNLKVIDSGGIDLVVPPKQRYMLSLREEWYRQYKHPILVYYSSSEELLNLKNPWYVKVLAVLRSCVYYEQLTSKVAYPQPEQKPELTFYKKVRNFYFFYKIKGFKAASQLIITKIRTYFK